MRFQPAPIESKLLNNEGKLTDIWSFWFKSLEKGKRTNFGTGQLDAATALLNLDKILGFATVILEPGTATQYYAFKDQIDEQRVLVYNNGTETATIDDVTSTIAAAKGLTIQWDTTLNKWIEG